MTNYINANYPQTTVTVYVSMNGGNGSSGTVSWFADYPDQATFYSVQHLLQNDPTYINYRDQLTPLFDASTLVDTLSQVMQ